jgi:glutaredoxin
LTGPVTVTVYARPGCHLCDEALAEIRSSGLGDGSLHLEVVDIESDERLLARFLERIPVVEVNGEVVSELVFDLDAFTGAIEMAGGTPTGYPD